MKHGSLPSDMKFKIWFSNNNGNVFMKVWKYCLDQIREASRNDEKCNLKQIVKSEEF